MITIHPFPVGLVAPLSRRVPLPFRARLLCGFNRVACLAIILVSGLSGCERPEAKSERKPGPPEASSVANSTAVSTGAQRPEGAPTLQDGPVNVSPENERESSVDLLNRTQRILGRWSRAAQSSAPPEPAGAPLVQEPASNLGLGGSTTQAVWNSIQQLRQTGGDSLSESAGWAQETYEYLKKQGLTQAGSAQEWLAGELQKKGTWEYRILVWNSELPATDLERALNDLGRENWECFQIDPVNLREQRVYLKRRVPSLLETLPVDRAWQIFQLWK